MSGGEGRGVWFGFGIRVTPRAPSESPSLPHWRGFHHTCNTIFVVLTINAEKNYTTYNMHHLDQPP